MDTAAMGRTDELGFLRELVRVFPVGLFQADLSGQCLFANEYLCRLSGLSTAQFLGLGWRDSIHPADRQRVVEDWGAAVVSGRAYRGEARVGASAESSIWVLIETVPVRDDAGDVSGFVGVVRETTAWREATEALRVSEERFRTICQHAPVMIDSFDEQGRCALWNEECIRQLGYTQAEVNECDDPLSLFYPDDAERSRVLEAIRLTDGQFREYQVHSKSGAVRTQLWANFRLPSGPSISVGHDVTDRKRAGEEIRASEQRFREMADHIREVFWLFDTRLGRIVYASPAYEQIWGRSVEALYADGGEWERAIHPEDASWALPMFERIARTAEEARREYRIVRPGGEVRWVANRGFAIRGEDGEVARIAGVAEDVTERKQEEESRRRLEQKLQHAQKLESLGVLAGGIAHDFNNLLMGVLGNADLALMALSSESAAYPYLNKIVGAAQRAAELTNQMLAYSGRGHFQVAPLDLNCVIDEMAHLLHTVISRKASLRLQLAGGLPPIEADSSQVQQVIMNLMTNASDAIGEAIGTIDVSSGRVQATREYLAQSYAGEDLPPGDYIYLEVRDDGRGMDPQTLRKIFDPFFTTKPSGRGLGLAAVLGIVRGHGGTVIVKTKPGEGTRFRVLFPPGQAPLPKQGVTAAAPPVQHGASVLVVDDDQSVREVAVAMLRRAGFRVLSACDGRDAVEQYRRRADEIALVLLDMVMPNLDGQETFRELKQIRPDVRVVLSSGYAEADATLRFADSGLAGFIQKPYQYALLLAKVREALALGLVQK